MNTTTIDRLAALERQVILLRAERDTLRAENEKLRASNRGICALADERVAEIHRLRLEVRALERKNALLRSEIDPDGEYLDGLALGMNIQFIGEKSAQDAAWLSARSQTTTPSKHREEKK